MKERDGRGDAEGRGEAAREERARKSTTEEGKEKERKNPLSMMVVHVYWISGSPAKV
jgi:hypothetical protein